MAERRGNPELEPERIGEIGSDGITGRFRRPREGGGPVPSTIRRWVPAFAATKEKALSEQHCTYAMYMPPLTCNVAPVM